MRRLRESLPGRHLMIDGETFSLGGRCVFTQLAAAEFWPTEPDRPGRVWGAYIDLADSMRVGRELDADTILWWMDDENGAGPAARQALVRGLRGGTLDWRGALEELDQFAQGPTGRGMGHRPEGVAGVWSHGSAFDVSRLETGYADLRMKCPWSYREQRDTRTLFQLAGSSLGRLAPETGTKHDAVADVQQQVVAVHAAIDILDGGE